ncbi:MAG: hypothetical protein OEY41_09480 [Acidimicrobiia bacterium]|nr:hypothetical protein [Acidimicrobiia bacterium]MDH5290220.1 hypothetical protein [Acidimicrobiia bacterium]
MTTEICVPTEARAVAIEPIPLGCRARAQAKVPVTATRRYETLDGTPDFGLHASPTLGDGIELTVGDSDVTCAASASLGDPERGARA